MIFDEFGIEHGLMTTVHATRTTRTSSTCSTRTCAERERRPEHHPDDDRAAKALALVIPELKGRFDGLPAGADADGLVIDFVAVKLVTPRSANEALASPPADR